MPLVMKLDSINDQMLPGFLACKVLSYICSTDSCTKECRISVRGETLYLTMLSAVTPTQ